MNIGVARPTKDELAAASHHFVACRSVSDPYNVFTFEQDALSCLDKLFQTYDNVIAVGGSGLYIEALCRGIALLPDPEPSLRLQLQQKLKEEGVASLGAMLQKLDPVYYNQVDRSNGIRIQRALEVCLTAGKPYSELISQPLKPRPFDIETIVINRDREDLRLRINTRVDQMMQQGLEDEARNLFPLRNLTPLNTVGYKEFFTIWNSAGEPYKLTPEQLITVADAIKLNTWHYAKKQLTWLKKKVETYKTIN